MLEDLNPQQQLAAEHVEGPMLVLAGAGSGKTRVISYRVANLLRRSFPASAILAVTFTNKAAEEMRERIQNLSRACVHTSTFHSLGAHILRKSIHHIGYQNAFAIYDQDDSLHLLKACLSARNFSCNKTTLRSIKSAISQAKNALSSPNDLQKNPSLPIPFPFAELFKSYQKKLQEYQALDFDDLLYLTVRLFQKHPDTLALYQKMWTFVSIDEYQDTNIAQYTIAKLLTAKHNNLFAVGDPDQSIYSWRGANFRNILNFETDFPGAKILSLQQNYRSTGHILRAANALIQQNHQRYAKNLWSALGPGEKIQIYRARSEREEALFIANALADVVQQSKGSLLDSAIFYRTNAQSRPLEDALSSLHLPYMIVGAISFYRRREIKDLLSLLKMAVSSADFLAFSRTINLPKRGIGQATLLKWQKAANERGLPILVFCKNLLEGLLPVSLTPKQGQALRDYLGLITALREMNAKNEPVDAIIRYAIDTSSYLDFLKEDQATYEDRKQNLNELVNKASEWQEENPAASFSSFLEELSLKATGNKEDAAGGVQLMTLHHSKGLEFSRVFITGLEEDLFPHINAHCQEETLEEERRLLYVGITRAKQQLCLTYAQHRTTWGSQKQMRPSRFLGEIPEEHCIALNPKEEDLEESPLEGPYKVGATVAHNVFGEGKIEKIYQTANGTTYDIYFATSKTTRSIIAKYAKFKPLT